MSAPSVFISMATLILASSLILLLALYVSARLSRNAAARHFVLISALACVLLIPLFKFAIPFHVTLSLPVSQPTSATFSRNLHEAKLLSREFRWLVEILLCAWVIGASFLVAQTGFALRAARRALLRSSQCHTLASIDLISLATRAGLRRSFELRVRRSGGCKSPLTWGTFRPVILLPRAAIHWTAERLESVLLHEMAHIRRNDHLWLLMARAACALYWFNPLAWRTARELHDAAEIAADDVAVTAGIRPTNYAAELLAIAAEMSGHPFRARDLALAIAGESGIEARICAIVDPASARNGLTTRLVICMVLTLMFAGIALAGLQPAFARPRTQSTAVIDVDPRVNSEAREYIFRTPVDSRDNPEARAYAGRRDK